MFNFSDINLEKLVVHSVGNKQMDGEVTFSKNDIVIEDEITNELLLKYFLTQFKIEEFYNFTNKEGYEHNDVSEIVSSIFENESAFLEKSRDLAVLLFDTSLHPKIKAGEFYIVLFKGIVVDGEVVDAVGLFKSENKDTYLKVFQKNENFEINHDNGININKLDKGCLIFNTEKEAGYKICIVDNVNKNNEAIYWKTDFLSLEARKDNFYQTVNQLELCKGFVKDVFNKENDVDRADQIDMLNRSSEYFSNNDKFSKNEFEDEVLRNPEVITAFNDYSQDFQTKNNFEPKNDFDISDDGYKKEKKFFKSILKLDKNFHVYIHGKRKLIEKGFDEEKEMKFYKLYFNDEE